MLNKREISAYLRQLTQAIVSPDDIVDLCNICGRISAAQECLNASNSAKIAAIRKDALEKLADLAVHATKDSKLDKIAFFGGKVFALDVIKRMETKSEV